MPKRQHHGIKFPLNILSEERTLLDLNMNKAEKVKSELLHLIFTPMGQRLRQPTFGSRLIQYIFNPNDNETWDNVVSDMKSMVSSWVPDCSLNSVDVYETDNGLGLMVDLNYSVVEDDGTVTTSTVTTNI